MVRLSDYPASKHQLEWRKKDVSVTVGVWTARDIETAT
jgi:hypothetical protein